MNVRNLRRLSHVPRCTILRTIRDTNVAEHTFHVMWIYVWLCARCSYPVSTTEFISVLNHDENEAFTGDIPASQKSWREPESTFDAILQVADKMEFILYCDEERQMGNTTLREARAHSWNKAHRTWEWLWKNWGGVSQWRTLSAVYYKLWEKVHG